MKVGILGKGQLGRMMAFAAEKLSCQVQFYEPKTKCYSPSYRAPTEDQLIGDSALEAFVASSDVVTFETENTSNILAQKIAHQKPFFPPVKMLEIASHRLHEKATFRALDIPVPDYYEVKDSQTLSLAANKLGFPFVLKTCTMGYDGKGQTVFKSDSQVKAFQFGENQTYIAEQWVKFDFETSIIGVRAKDGTTVFYPMGQNEHRDGILYQSRIVPGFISPEVQKAAEKYCARLINHFSYVGVFTLELFVMPQGQLLANECAPRVHNSGHWTIEGAVCSQFENHLRAITGAPLGATDVTAPYIVMENIIGRFPQNLPHVENLHLHDYEKSPRPGRKLGHITVCAQDKADFETTLGVLDK